MYATWDGVYTSGLISGHRKKGRKRLLDETAEADLIADHGGIKVIQLSEEESERMINQRIRETAKRRNSRCLSQIRLVIYNTKRNIERRLHIITKPAELQSDARERACASIRNAVSGFVMICNRLSMFLFVL